MFVCVQRSGVSGAYKGVLEAGVYSYALPGLQVQRDKNFPCIAFWSLGNESGYVVFIERGGGEGGERGE